MATLKNVYAPGPAVTRGKPVHFGADPKGKSFIYAASRNIVIRNVNDPLDSDVYSQHTSDCTVAKYAPSGFYIASGDSHGKVRIWDTVNKEHVLKIELPVLAGPVNDLAWTEDSKRIVAVGEGREQFGAAFLFDSGSTVGTISGHSKAINSCDVKPNRPYRAVTGGLDNQVNFFPGPPFKFDHSIKDHTRFINCIRYSPDGSKFISVASDKRAYVYDGKSGEQISVFANEKEGGHTAGIYSVSWNAESTKVLTASADKTARIFDVASGKCEVTFTFAEKASTEHQQLGCLWMGDTLLSMSLGGVLSVLDVDNPTKPKRKMFGHSKTVTALAYDSASQALLSGDTSGVVVRWDTVSATTHMLGEAPHTNQLKRIAVDGEWIVSTAMDDTVRFAKRGDTPDYTASVSTDGLPYDVAAVNGTVVVATNRAVQLIREQSVKATVAVTWEATAVAISPDGKQAAVGGSDNIIRVYSIGASSLDEVRQMTGHRGLVTSIAYSPNGEKIASTGKMRQVRVWNAADGSPIITDEWCFHSAPPLRVNWAPDSNRIITGGLDSDIYIWNLETPTKRIAQNQAHPLGVTDVLFLDNNTIASTGYDCTIRTWTI